MAEYDANECVRCDQFIDLLFPEDVLFDWYKYGICTECWSRERDSIKPFYMFDYNSTPQGISLGPLVACALGGYFKGY